MTETELRRIERLIESRVPLTGTSNVRDLGGYPAGGDRLVGPRRLLRGELLAQPGGTETRQSVFDPSTSAEFSDLGLRTVLDLRSRHEMASSPSAWAAATGAAVVALPIEEGGEGTDTNYVRKLLDGEMAGFTEDDMTAFYLRTLDRQASTFAAVVEHLAGPGTLPALIHCAAGKDRTGLAVALVLELLGTPRDVVVEDYALTEVLRPDRIAAYRTLFDEAGRDPETARVLFGSPAQSMADVLVHLDTTYGGAEAYLVDKGGLTAGAPARLRESLLVDGPDMVK